MKKYLVLTSFVFAFALAVTPSFAKSEKANGPAPKVDICHLDKDTGLYQLINVSENAKNAHLNHGDALPNDVIPGGTVLDYQKFAADCSLVSSLKETIEVSAGSSVGATGNVVLASGKNYILQVTGTGMACNQPGCVISFDAEYSTSDGTNWVDGVAAPYTSYGTNLLDLKVDGAFVDWGAYNELHTYQLSYPGTGNPLSLVVYDIAGSYYNDTGTFFVKVYEQL